MSEILCLVGMFIMIGAGIRIGWLLRRDYNKEESNG